MVEQVRDEDQREEVQEAPRSGEVCERVREDDRTEESRRASTPAGESAGRDLVDAEDGEAEGVRTQA